MYNILILYPEIMPYNLPVWRILRDKGNYLKIIQIGGGKLTPYQYNGEEGIEVHDVSEWSDFKSFRQDNFNNQLKLLFVSEVMNVWYWRLARYYHSKNKSLPIVLGSDAQWTGNRNNYLKKILFGVSYKKCFTHVLSAGLWQVVYALKIGFKRNQILTPLYCANNDQYYKVDIEKKVESYPKRFLFVGRLARVKGIENIIEAWNSIVNKKGWTLTMIGNGDMQETISKHHDIELLPFMSQNEISKIMQDSGCALIPSLYEPWGLVIHEAAAAGLPIIVSKNCGATNQFVKHGVNGYLIKEGDTDSLKNAMQTIINANEDDLLSMSRNSRDFSKSITPEAVASAMLYLMN